MTIQELQVLKEKYEKALNEKLTNRIFKESEKVEVVSIIGNNFVEIVNNDLQLKNFNIKASKTMNVLLFTIINDDCKIANILFSTEDISTNVIKINEVMVDFLIDEDFLNRNLCE